MDILYDHNIRLFCSAQGTPFQLFEHIVTRNQSRPSSPEVFNALTPHTAACALSFMPSCVHLVCYNLLSKP